MEISTFRNVVSEGLKSAGFTKNRSSFYKITDDLISSVELQRSNFSNGYYINVGFFIRVFHPNILNYHTKDADVRLRFIFSGDEKNTDMFDLDNLSEQELYKSISLNVEAFISKSKDLDGLKNMILDNLYILYQTKMNVKTLLELK